MHIIFIVVFLLLSILLFYLFSVFFIEVCEFCICDSMQSIRGPPIYKKLALILNQRTCTSD